MVGHNYKLVQKTSVVLLVMCKRIQQKLSQTLRLQEIAMLPCPGCDEIGIEPKVARSRGGLLMFTSAAKAA